MSTLDDESTSDNVPSEGKPNKNECTSYDQKLKDGVCEEDKVHHDTANSDSSHDLTSEILDAMKTIISSSNDERTKEYGNTLLDMCTSLQNLAIHGGNTTTNSSLSDILGIGFVPKELLDDKIFDDPPPKDECPICLVPMTYMSNWQFEGKICDVDKTYMPCCGKYICGGCCFGVAKEIKSGNMKQWCALCRVPYTASGEEFVKRVEKRMKLNDSEAYHELGFSYFRGTDGLPQDHRKGFELMTRAAELGSINGHFELGYCFQVGNVVEKDMEKAIHHYKLAAMGGHENARYNLGRIEGMNGNDDRAMKHFMIGARSGEDDSLKEVGFGYKHGLVTKDEYANTLRAHKDAQDEMKSEQRTKAHHHLKLTGKII